MYMVNAIVLNMQVICHFTHIYLVEHLCITAIQSVLQRGASVPQRNRKGAHIWTWMDSGMQVRKCILLTTYNFSRIMENGNQALLKGSAVNIILLSINNYETFLNIFVVNHFNEQVTNT